ncbi:MAG: 2-phosphosulfolactate phosphatase [Rhodothermales bacterium]
MKKGIDIFFTPVTLSDQDLSGKLVVIIDVFRASSTIVTALGHGAREVLPASDYGTAGLLASKMGSDARVLGGERDGRPIDGYDLGNSPLEYTKQVVARKSVILITTNGTPALMGSRTARLLVVGCFLNADMVAKSIADNDLDTFLVCCGWKGRASLEDTVCAGLIVDRLFHSNLPDNLPDSVRMAHMLYNTYRDNLTGTLSHSTHADRLRAIGYEHDVEYCLQIDHVPVLPVFDGGRLKLAD